VERAAGFAAAPLGIWPGNWKTVLLFAALGTQWRAGMAGPVGLDYAVLPMVARQLRIRLKRSRFAALQAMEAEVLRIFKERRSDG
jgi:hypothetical protein